MDGLLASLLLGYALGSVPVVYLLARAWGVDICSVGTGNPGAANVYRAVGRVPGVLVFLADAMKGAGAVLLARALGVAPELVVLAGAAAVVGHWYPLALRFRGGAGLATALGRGPGFAAPGWARGPRPWPGRPVAPPQHRPCRRRGECCLPAG
ncbi:MAG: hypothetical protein EXR60_02030 [Dehalococcoidia bacterium]|nr:hypothetical protein [Dehalococcoidia bacterium]